MAKKSKQKTLIFVIALMITIGFFGYKAIKFYKKNVGPKYCTKKDTSLTMSRSEALQIAKQSECMKEGRSIPFGHECNEHAGQWWLSLIVLNKKNGCFPICVVDIATKNAVINWRCTGVIQ